MPFDVDAFRAAHRPWSFTVGGRVFTARHVSAPQVFDYQRRVALAAGDLRRRERALRRLLRIAFPWRLSYAVYGDPVKLIWQLEPAARQEALADFFEALRGGPETSRARLNAPATPGTTSSTPTPTVRR